MMQSATPNLDRLYDLLADEALQGLSPEEHAELQQLRAAHPDVDPEMFLVSAAAAAAAMQATDQDSSEPMPAHLREEVQADTRRFVRTGSADVAESTDTTDTQPALNPLPFSSASAPHADPPAVSTRLVPWLVAAACIILAILAWWPALSPTPGPATPDYAAERQEFVEAHDDLIRREWTDVEGENITGDVVWSNAEQRGYMRFKNLDPNDPSDYQYQLWIFDDARQTFNAVDGGVFNVDSATGEVIIPINAKLKVFEPNLFAVTTEPPGGVVKHDPELDPERFRIILTAPVG